jgi:hypothetical protein
MAEVIASSVAGAAESSAALGAAFGEVAAAEAELAALVGTETALEAEMVIEGAGGPVGWIFLAVTAGILAGVIMAVIAANNRLTQARFNLGVQQTNTKLPQPGPTPTTNTPIQTPNKAPISPDVVNMLNSIPTGPVVMFSEFFDCDEDNGVLSRCERYRFSHF